MTGRARSSAAIEAVGRNLLASERYQGNPRDDANVLLCQWPVRVDARRADACASNISRRPNAGLKSE